jgi:UDP-3-O-[3-hydroxymyristoyl] N-acetylglucosamine deacetylase/3-hydroxyacyl-[acyl-carrier-protein] dehydratase
MDIHKIMCYRTDPFYLSIELKCQTVMVGMKNVTMNENFFAIFRSTRNARVIIVEAMAQTGGILVLSTVPDPENYLTYFMKIDNVKFKQKVLPGDT